MSRGPTGRYKAPETMDSFSPEQIEAFQRDGLLIVEEGLSGEQALEVSRER
jgi:hypothetical protein